MILVSTKPLVLAQRAKIVEIVWLDVMVEVYTSTPPLVCVRVYNDFVISCIYQKINIVTKIP